MPILPNIWCPAEPLPAPGPKDDNPTGPGIPGPTGMCDMGSDPG